MTSKELREARRQLGLNQEQLGRKLGLSKGTVGVFERNIRPVPRAVALAIRYLISQR